jgi:ribosomal protein S19E (S16A)
MQKDAKRAIVPVGSLPPGLVTDFSVSRDDVLAIVVSKKEQELLKAKEDADKELEQLEKKAECAHENLKRTVQEAGERLLGEAITRVNTILKQCGAGSLKIDASLVEDRSDNKRYINIKLVNETNCMRRPLTPEVKSVLANIEALRGEAAAAEKATIVARQGLAQLPAMERLARAAWAKRALCQTPEGRQFLESFSKEVQR